MTTSNLSESLHRLMHVYKSQLRSGIRQQGITLPINQVRALKGVGRIQNCTAKLIADRMNQDKAQIARVVNGLLEQGLIEKAENPDDRRSQYLVATAEGDAMLTKIDTAEEQAAVFMTRKLNAEELQTFIRLSAAMTDSKPTDTGLQANG